MYENMIILRDLKFRKFSIEIAPLDQGLFQGSELAVTENFYKKFFKSELNFGQRLVCRSMCGLKDLN